MHSEEHMQEIYEQILQLNPDMWHTARLARLARERKLQFPLRKPEDLAPLADKGCEAVDLGKIRLTLQHAKDFLPAKVFPIEDEHDFIMKVFLALDWGSRVHALEAQLRQVRPGAAATAAR